MNAVAMVAIRIRLQREGRKFLRRAKSPYQLTAAIVVPTISPLSKRHFWKVRAAWTESVKDAAVTTEIKAAALFIFVLRSIILLAMLTATT